MPAYAVTLVYSSIVTTEIEAASEAEAISQMRKEFATGEGDWQEHIEIRKPDEGEENPRFSALLIQPSPDGLSIEIESFGTVHVDPDRGMIWQSERPLGKWSQAEADRAIAIVAKAYPDAGLEDDGYWTVVDGTHS